MLRIVTYNIHFGKRLKKIIPWIDEQNTADIICLQEFPKTKLADFYKELSLNWGHRHAQSFILRKKTYCIVTLFRKKNIHLVQTKTLHMGVHPMEKRFLGNPMEKSCLITTLKTARKTLTVANAHLVFLAANGARYKQVRLIAQFVSKCNHASIIMGDFNLHSIQINKKLIALMKEYGFRTSPKRLATHRLIIKHQLDYVFGSQCKIVKLETPRVRFSDHYPVIAEVVL